MKAKSIFSKLIAGVAAAAMVVGMMPGMSMTAKADSSTTYNAGAHLGWYTSETSAMSDKLTSDNIATGADTTRYLKPDKGYRFTNDTEIGFVANSLSVTYNSSEVATTNKAFTGDKTSDAIAVTVRAAGVPANDATVFTAGSSIKAEKIPINFIVDIADATNKGIKAEDPTTTTAGLSLSSKSHPKYTFEKLDVDSTSAKATVNLEDGFELDADKSSVEYAGKTLKGEDAAGLISVASATATVNLTATDLKYTDNFDGSDLTLTLVTKKKTFSVTNSLEAGTSSVKYNSSVKKADVTQGPNNVDDAANANAIQFDEEVTFTLDPALKAGETLVVTNTKLDGTNETLTFKQGDAIKIKVTGNIDFTKINKSDDKFDAMWTETTSNHVNEVKGTGSGNKLTENVPTSEDVTNETEYTFEITVPDDKVASAGFAVTVEVNGGETLTYKAQGTADESKGEIPVDVSGATIKIVVPKDKVIGDLVMTIANNSFTDKIYGAYSVADDEGLGDITHDSTGTALTTETQNFDDTATDFTISPAAGYMISKDGLEVTYTINGGEEVKVKVSKASGGKLTIPAASVNFMLAPPAGQVTVVKFVSVTGFEVDPNYDPNATPSGDPNAFKDVDAEKPEKPGTSAPESTGDRGSSKAPVFTDLVPGSVHNDDISRAAQLGLIKGVGNGQFNPLGILSRAEAATLIHRALGTPAPTKTVSKFVDVVAPLHGDHINAILYHEAQTPPIVKGITETRFEPYWNVTRAMFVTFIWRAAGEPAGADSKFADLSADWYKTAVNWAAAQGIVKGYSDTSFGPNDVITREQAASILVRAYDKGVFGKASAAPATTDETKIDETKTDESKTDGAADGEKTDAATEGEKTESDAA